MDSDSWFFLAIIVIAITVGSSISFDTYNDNKLVNELVKSGCDIKYKDKNKIDYVKCIVVKK